MKVKDAFTNLNPVFAVALAPFAPPIQVDTEWLAFCKAELRNAQHRAEITPEWNADKQTWQAAVIRLERDIEELEAGVSRDDLTSAKRWTMPAWGTYDS